MMSYRFALPRSSIPSCSFSVILLCVLSVALSHAEVIPGTRILGPNTRARIVEDFTRRNVEEDLHLLLHQISDSFATKLNDKVFKSSTNSNRYDRTKKRWSLSDIQKLKQLVELEKELIRQNMQELVEKIATNMDNIRSFQTIYKLAENTEEDPIEADQSDDMQIVQSELLDMLVQIDLYLKND